mmetsp:Transcript_20815/g.32122  ORF Transcript_20815/g.32122 Transcript_20815/m.32122 type:complete len:88 (+) Transcript_20815:1936-2199(+)
MTFAFQSTISIDSSDDEFVTLFSINAFDHSTMSLLGPDYPVGILNDNKEIQLHDHQSTFKIEILSDDPVTEESASDDSSSESEDDGV